MTVANRLRSERRAQGFCIWKFAGFAGVRAFAQSRYERGVRSPTAIYLNALHNLGMDVSYILVGVRTKAIFLPHRKMIH